MKDESLHPWIEPELEARIVALVLGEASDFEKEGLERLIEEKSELGLFRERIAAMHALLKESGNAASESDAGEWKLDQEKRGKVLEVLGGDVKSPVEVTTPQEAKRSGRRIFPAFLKVAAAAALVVFFLGFLMPASISTKKAMYSIPESESRFFDKAEESVDQLVTDYSFFGRSKGAGVSDTPADGADGADGLGSDFDSIKFTGSSNQSGASRVEMEALVQLGKRSSDMTVIPIEKFEVRDKRAESAPPQEEPMRLAELPKRNTDRLSRQPLSGGKEQTNAPVSGIEAEGLAMADPYLSDLGENESKPGRRLLERADAGRKAEANAQFGLKSKENQLDFPAAPEASEIVEADSLADPLADSLAYSRVGHGGYGINNRSAVAGGLSWHQGPESVDGGLGAHQQSQESDTPQPHFARGRVTFESEVDAGGKNDTEMLSSLNVAGQSVIDGEALALKKPAVTSAPVPATITVRDETKGRFFLGASADDSEMMTQSRGLDSNVPGQPLAPPRGGTEATTATAVNGTVMFGDAFSTVKSGMLSSDLDAVRLNTPELKAKELVREVPLSFNELSAKEEPFSTFSLHVSDVSFKLAQAALAKGEWPDSERIRIEEFVNAFDYGDPLPGQDEKVSAVLEQTIHPFLQQRNLLRVSMRTAETGRNASTPLRLTFLLDNSGSMERSDRRDTVRSAFAVLASMLQPADEVTLISFARQPRLLADRVAGDQAAALVETVANLPSEGGTNLEAALDLAFEKALEQQTPGAQNRIILLTDGAANLGDARPEKLSARVETMRNAGIAFDAAGIGTEGLNDEILEALTRKGDGRYYLLDRKEDVDSGFAKQIAGALRPAAGNVKIQMEFNPDRVGKYKLLGFEKHRLNKEDFRNDQVDAAELAAAEAGVAVYQIETIADGEGDIGAAFVRFRDMSTGKMTERRWTIPYQSHPPRPAQASPSMQVATVAAMLGAKLKGGVAGDVVDLDELNQIVSQLPPSWREKPRVAELTKMINSARSIAGR